MTEGGVEVLGHWGGGLVELECLQNVTLCQLHQYLHVAVQNVTLCRLHQCRSAKGNIVLIASIFTCHVALRNSIII